MLCSKGGADPTFASAKVRDAIGRIGIFFLSVYVGRQMGSLASEHAVASVKILIHFLLLGAIESDTRTCTVILVVEGRSFESTVHS